MDPDHVVAATGGGGGERAAHQYHVTDDTDAATASEEVGGGGGWPRALLRRGWELAGKAAVAGAAATAAPVVVPPVMLLTAAGLALSLPFAAYLATLAATHRLMAALLPPHESGLDGAAVEQELLDAFYHFSTTDQEEDGGGGGVGIGLASPPPSVDEPVSFQESSVSRNGGKIEDGTTKETVSLTTDVPEFPELPVVETREEDGVIPVQQLGQDHHHTHVLDTGDKAEESTISSVSGTPVEIFTDKDNVEKGVVEDTVVVEAAVVEQLASNAGIVAQELVDTNVAIVAISAPENEATTPTSDLVARVSEEVVGSSCDGEMQETAVVDDTMRELSDANMDEDVQHHDQRVVCSSVLMASPLAVGDYEDVMSSGSTQDIPEVCDETSQPGQEHDQSDGFEAKVISGDKYTCRHSSVKFWIGLEGERCSHPATCTGRYRDKSIRPC
nr:uncharacterized protein LOC4352296 isoform X2 [Oryza sativa Japonica Group]